MVECYNPSIRGEWKRHIRILYELKFPETLRSQKTIIELPGNKLFRLGTANNGINALKYIYKAYLLPKKVGKYYKKIKKKK